MPDRSARDASTIASVRDRGVEPRSPGWKPGVVPLDQSRGPRQAEGEGVEPSRLIARPSSSRVPSPIGLPFRSIISIELRRQESNLRRRRLTAGRSYQHELHRNRRVDRQSGWPDLNRRSPAPEAGGLARLSHIPRLVPTSAQRESNPHVRHGKAVGCRYIMGTITDAELSKRPRAPGGTRTHVAALRVRSLRRWTTSADCIGVGPEGLEPSPTWLRAGRLPLELWSRHSHHRRVGPEGVEPSSPGYQPSALPLSYRPLPFASPVGRRRGSRTPRHSLIRRALCR